MSKKRPYCGRDYLAITNDRSCWFCGKAEGDKTSAQSIPRAMTVVPDCPRCKILEAELAEERKHHMHFHQAWQRECDKVMVLEAAIEQLQKALKKIVRLKNGGTYQSCRVKEIKKIAKDALDGK